MNTIISTLEYIADRFNHYVQQGFSAIIAIPEKIQEAFRSISAYFSPTTTAPSLEGRAFPTGTAPTQQTSNVAALTLDHKKQKTIDPTTQQTRNVAALTLDKYKKPQTKITFPFPPRRTTALTAGASAIVPTRSGSPEAIVPDSRIVAFVPGIPRTINMTWPSDLRPITGLFPSSIRPFGPDAGPFANISQPGNISTGSASSNAITTYKPPVDASRRAGLHNRFFCFGSLIIEQEQLRKIGKFIEDFLARNPGKIINVDLLNGRLSIVDTNLPTLRQVEQLQEVLPRPLLGSTASNAPNSSLVEPLAGRLTIQNPLAGLALPSLEDVRIADASDAVLRSPNSTASSTQLASGLNDSDTTKAYKPPRRKPNLRGLFKVAADAATKTPLVFPIWMKSADDINYPPLGKHEEAFKFANAFAAHHGIDVRYIKPDARYKYLAPKMIAEFSKKT